MSDSRFDGDSIDSLPSRKSGERLASQDVHPIDYVKVLYKRRWTALMAFVVVVGTVTINTFTATRIYQARTRLLIETDNPNVVSFKAVVEENQTRQDYYQTQYNILQSRALARGTLSELNLWNTPPFGGVRPQPSVTSRVLRAPFAIVAAVIRAFAPSDPAANTLPEADETAAQSRAIDVFLSRLAVVPIRASRLVDLKYELPDPVM